MEQYTQNINPNDNLQTDESAPSTGKDRTITLQRYAIAASVTLLCIALVFWQFSATAPLPFQQQSSQRYLAQQPLDQQHGQLISDIASEVTKNHIKLKPLEVKSNTLQPLRQYFTELDFTPQFSQKFGSLAGIRDLVGGRYCSIQSINAAQLRFKNSDDKASPWSTLYQVEYSPDIFGAIPKIELGETPLVTYSRGLKVSLWVEKELLMVSVE